MIRAALTRSTTGTFVHGVGPVGVARPEHHARNARVGEQAHVGAVGHAAQRRGARQHLGRAAAHQVGQRVVERRVGARELPAVQRARPGLSTRPRRPAAPPRAARRRGRRPGPRSAAGRAPTTTTRRPRAGRPRSGRGAQLPHQRMVDVLVPAPLELVQPAVDVHVAVDRAAALEPEGGVGAAPADARRRSAPRPGPASRSSRLGSGISAPSAPPSRRTASNVPRPPSSSDTTLCSTASPAARRPAAHHGPQRVSAATSPPFMSSEPRPCTAPSSSHPRWAAATAACPRPRCRCARSGPGGALAVPRRAASPTASVRGASSPGKPGRPCRVGEIDRPTSPPPARPPGRARPCAPGRVARRR